MRNPSLLRAFLLWGLLPALVLVLLLALAMLGRQFVLHSARFQVGSVEVLTEGPAQKEELIRLAAIPKEANLFALDLSAVKTRIENDPWVGEASVSRAFPNRILIRYQAEIPVAILNLQEMYYANARGELFARVRQGDSLQFPLLQIRGTKERSRVLPERVRPALELLNILQKSKVLPAEAISELLISGAEEHGGVAFSVTAHVPDSRLRFEKNKKSQIMMLRFSEEEVAQQWKRAEAILRYLLQSGKAPRFVRLELGKKVVVKID